MYVAYVGNYANDAKIFLKHLVTVYFINCSTCADSITSLHSLVNHDDNYSYKKRCLRWVVLSSDPLTHSRCDGDV